MSKPCCVCSEAKESKNNLVFTCKGSGCDVSVHQGCYGIVTVPTGLWFCRKCESQERAARVRCELCPKKEGALKRTDCGGWAHVVCALYIPEVIFGNNRVMEPIITTKLPRERFSKSCYICEEKGNETQATYGACMSCHKSSCRLAFHVTCAQRERLLCEEEDSRDSRNIIYCGYCATHHKKMLRQKHKQVMLRKPVFPPSSNSAVFPTTPTSPSPSSVTPLTLPDHMLSEPGMAREVEHRFAGTESGYPLKGPTKVQKERPSLSDVPTKRSSVDTPLNPSSKTKHRKRKPSSSNESTTSEAPSNGSDLPLIPPVVPPSPSSFNSHQTIGLPMLLPVVSKGHHLVRNGRDQMQKGGGPQCEETLEVGDQLQMTHTDEISAENDRRLTNNSSHSSSDHCSRMQAPPPRSLQALLERQWEQTAQFILDQAGKQNNAGSMLAHLHTLQSENRQMQSRIMELASQREFYIAINTKLRQTLTDHEPGHLLNGVQSVGDGLQQQIPPRGEDDGTTASMDVSVEHKHLSRTSHRCHQSNTKLEPSIPASSSLTKEDILHTHLSSSTVNGSVNSDSPGTYSTSREKEEHVLSSHHRSHYHHHNHQGDVGGQGGGGGTGHQLVTSASNFLPTLTQLPAQIMESQNLPSIQASVNPLSCSNPPVKATPIPLHTHASLVDYTHPMEVSQQDPSMTLHEITRVTNSVQAPISSLTPLPNDASTTADDYTNNRRAVGSS